MSRAIVWFSCGAASAIAAMYAIKKYDYCDVVYCDTGGEHNSNIKFLSDIESLIGKKITILKNLKLSTLKIHFLYTHHTCHYKLL